MYRINKGIKFQPSKIQSRALPEIPFAVVSSLSRGRWLCGIGHNCGLGREARCVDTSKTSVRTVHPIGLTIQSTRYY